jgi:hypothetical protein
MDWAGYRCNKTAIQKINERKKMGLIGTGT